MIVILVIVVVVVVVVVQSFLRSSWDRRKGEEITVGVAFAVTITITIGSGSGSRIIIISTNRTIIDIGTILWVILINNCVVVVVVCMVCIALPIKQMNRATC